MIGTLGTLVQTNTGQIMDGKEFTTILMDWDSFRHPLDVTVSTI